MQGSSEVTFVLLNTWRASLIATKKCNLTFPLIIFYNIPLATLFCLPNWKSFWDESNDLVGMPSGWFVWARSGSMMRGCDHGVSASGGHGVSWCDVLNKTDLGKGLALTSQCSDPALSPMLAAIVTSPLKNDWMVGVVQYTYSYWTYSVQGPSVQCTWFPNEYSVVLNMQCTCRVSPLGWNSVVYIYILWCCVHIWK